VSWNIVNDVEGEWPVVIEKLRPCFETGLVDFSEEDLQQWLRSRRMRLLVYHGEDEAYQMACVFELVDYPAKRIFRVVMLAGDSRGQAFAEWESEVEEFVRMLGCSEIEAWCKDPQARLFRRWGLEKQCNIVRKEV